MCLCDTLFMDQKKSEQMKIYTKLLSVKGELGKISKDATNPFFKSKYFDVNGLLEHVEPLLAKHGLLLLQPILTGKVVTEIIDPESGEKVSSEIELPNLQDPQKLGSAITYFRRYTLQSLLGLQAEDDDGNKASKSPFLPQNIKADILTKLTKTKTQVDLKKLYAAEISSVNKYPELKDLFTTRKNEL